MPARIFCYNVTVLYYHNVVVYAIHFLVFRSIFSLLHNFFAETEAESKKIPTGFLQESSGDFSLFLVDGLHGGEL